MVACPSLPDRPLAVWSCTMYCVSRRAGCGHKRLVVQRLRMATAELDVVHARRPGLEIDPQNGTSCRDVDECADNNGGCEQGCTNLDPRKTGQASDDW